MRDRTVVLFPPAAIGAGRRARRQVEREYEIGAGCQEAVQVGAEVERVEVPRADRQIAADAGEKRVGGVGRFVPGSHRERRVGLLEQKALSALGRRERWQRNDSEGENAAERSTDHFSHPPKSLHTNWHPMGWVASDFWVSSLTSPHQSLEPFHHGMCRY